MKSIALLAAVGALSIVGAALADGGGPSASGGSHLITHNVFGLQTLELQDFGFNAKITTTTITPISSKSMMCATMRRPSTAVGSRVYAGAPYGCDG